MIVFTAPDFDFVGKIGENETKMSLKISLFFRQYWEFAVDLRSNFYTLYIIIYLKR
jgi:hypothetical protein